MKKTALLIFFAFMCAALRAPAVAAERQGCDVCGMYLDMYQRTRFVITFADGSIKQTCSIACAAGLIEQGKGRIKSVKAADFLTGNLLDAGKTYYLEGSDIPGVMTYTSRIAFPSQAQARAFQKKHGGRIITFDKALKNQLADKQ